MKRAVAAFLVVALASATAGSSTASARPVHHEDPAATLTDADWILRAQMPDGAIATYVDRVGVSPYLANYAAMGLAAAAAKTGNAGYVAAAWQWVRWYQDHEDQHGFVTDYRVVGGRLQSTGDMDSTDAYAGTYLLAVRDVWSATGDAGRLRSVAQGVAGAVTAIEATQDVDGLTWAKPGWRVKYLMDEAETYAGLVAAVDLAVALGDTVLEARAGADARGIAAGVAGLWNPQTGAYDWAVHGDGSHASTDWGRLYPDAMQQAWAVSFGLVTGDRAKQLMATFAAAQPAWSSPTATADVEGQARPVGYWAVPGLAYRLVGNAPRAAAAVLSIEAAADATGRAWPFTPADAGELLLVGQPMGATPAPVSSLVAPAERQVRLPYHGVMGSSFL